jgi:hypothetical protein
MEAKKGISEDWLSLWLGLSIFVLSMAVFVGADLLGWGTKTSVRTQAGQAFAPISKSYASLSGIVSLLVTYAFVLFLMGIGALLLRANLKRFASGFTLVYWISAACWFLGHYGYIAATRVAALENELASSAGASSDADFNRQLEAARAGVADIVGAAQSSQATLATAKTATDESNVFRQFFL